MDMMKVKAIQESRWPLIHKGLRSLLGLANYYHHFIQDFSKVARTLSNLFVIWPLYLSRNLTLGVSSHLVVASLTLYSINPRAHSIDQYFHILGLFHQPRIGTNLIANVLDL